VRSLSKDMALSYHIAVTGDTLSGKTSLMSYVKDGKFHAPAAQSKKKGEVSAPPGIDEDEFPWSMSSGTSDGHFDCKVNVDGKQRDLTALDGGRVASGGRMDMTYYTIPQQFTNANAIIVCYDTSKPHGLRRSFRLLQMAQRDAGIYGAHVFLVGCKIDERAKEHSFEAAQKEANEHLCDSYYECSAKTSEGVTDLIEAIFHELDAIKERDGQVPLIPDMTARQQAYQEQRQQTPQPTKPRLTAPSTPDAMKKKPTPMQPAPASLKAVKGGARPAKQASPCMIQ